MKLINIFKKFFIGGCWTLAYRTYDKNDPDFCTNIFQNEYKVLSPTKRFWYADPFLYEVDNRNFVFCEVYDEFKKKGCIGVAEIKDNQISIPNIVVEKGYHMSYPCIFNHNGIYYMIPETSENKTIELYRAICFPNKWILDTILIKNVYSVDTTIFKHEDNIILFTYEYLKGLNYLKIYKLNMFTKKIELQICNPYLKNVGRPAGNIFEYKGKLIRPSQDERVKYGEKVIFNEIIKWESSRFEEKQIGTISFDNISLKDYREIKRVHTFNKCHNVEIIDVRTEIFDFFLIIKKFIRKIKTNLRKRNLKYEN